MRSFCERALPDVIYSLFTSLRLAQVWLTSLYRSRTIQRLSHLPQPQNCTENNEGATGSVQKGASCLGDCITLLDDYMYNGSSMYRISLA